MRHRTLTLLTASALAAAAYAPAAHGTELTVTCTGAQVFVGHTPERAWEISVNGQMVLTGRAKGTFWVDLPLGGTGNVQLWTGSYRNPLVVRSAPQAVAYFNDCPTQPTYPVTPTQPEPGPAPAATPQPVPAEQLPVGLVEPPITLPAPRAPRAPRATPLRRRALICARLTRAGAGPRWRARYRCGPAPRRQTTVPAVAGERR